MSNRTSEKRLCDMNIKELEAEACRYEEAGEAGAYWARLCREQIGLLRAIAASWGSSVENRR